MKNSRFLIILLVAFLAVGCDAVGGLVGPTATPEPTPTPTMTPEETRAGLWMGATEFGAFTFVVSDDGMTVTDWSASYYAGITSGSIDPQGELAIPIDEDNAFSIDFGSGIFECQFSDDGHSATGLYEISIALAGEYSEEWTIER
nr:hypothetical protein [Anaerolineae bacterium]